MKNNKVLIILVVILGCLVLGLGGYIVCDKVLFKDSVNNDDKTSNNENVDNNDKLESNVDEEILMQDDFNYKLNNVEHKISYVYKYSVLNETEKVYQIYLDILLDDKIIEGFELLLFNDNESINLDDFMNMKDINKNSIHKIKGGNKEYIVFCIEHANQNLDGGINPLIVSENGKLIYELEFMDGQSINEVFENERNEDYKIYDDFVIEEDRIYYLDPYNLVGDEISSDKYKTFQEYELVIENGKVKINALDKYLVNASGAI